MIAFQISVNGELLCTVSSAYVVNVIAMLKGELTEGGSEPPALNVSGLISAHTHATWLNQELTEGDAITLVVVDVPESTITEPTSITQNDPDFVEQQRRAYYEGLKAEYEPTTP